MSAGQVITFYSYKGGVGRTFVLANVAALYAQWGLKVLCVDWDLEAPGLHLYLQPDPATDGAGRFGLIELFTEYDVSKPLAWRERVQRVSIKDAAHGVDLLPAGAPGEDYERRMQALDWAQMFSERGLGLAIEQMRDEWRETYDLILVDSRTGITDIGGICTILLPDVLVLLGTSNHQSLQGLLRVAELADRARSNLPVDRGLLRVLPVLTRFESRVEVERSRAWLGQFHETFAPWVRRWITEGTSIPDLLNHVRVPNVPFWTFGEELAVITEGTSDPESVGYAIETLAALLQHGLDDADRLLASREPYVAESAEASNPFPVDVLLLHTGAEADLSAKLEAALGALGERVTSYSLRQSAAGDRLREARNVVFVTGEAPTPKELDSIAVYLRRFYAERPPVGRILPVLHGSRLPGVLASFSPIPTREEKITETVLALREQLRPAPRGRLRREGDPDLWRPVEVSVSDASEGFEVKPGNYRIEAGDLTLNFTVEQDTGPEIHRLLWTRLLNARWLWEWGDFSHHHHLNLGLWVQDRLGVVASHWVYLSGSAYELQRLLRQIEAACHWPRRDPDISRQVPLETSWASD